MTLNIVLVSESENLSSILRVRFRSSPSSFQRSTRLGLALSSDSRIAKWAKKTSLWTDSAIASLTTALSLSPNIVMRSTTARRFSMLSQFFFSSAELGISPAFSRISSATVDAHSWRSLAYDFPDCSLPCTGADSLANSIRDFFSWSDNLLKSSTIRRACLTSSSL